VEPVRGWLNTACANLVAGPGYASDQVFNLETMEPYSLTKLYDAFSRITREIVLYLPRTSNLNQIAKFGKEEDMKVQVTHYCVKGASKVCFPRAKVYHGGTDIAFKALCVFYGMEPFLPAADGQIEEIEEAG